MTSQEIQVVRVARRLREAIGYLELDLPRSALDCLENLGDLGALEAQVEFVRGEAHRMRRHFQAAAKSLTAAAQKMPPPHNRPAWLALSNCYRQAGDVTRAVQSLGFARGAWPGMMSAERNRP